MEKIRNYAWDKAGRSDGKSWVGKKLKEGREFAENFQQEAVEFLSPRLIMCLRDSKIKNISKSEATIQGIYLLHPPYSDIFSPNKIEKAISSLRQIDAIEDDELYINSAINILKPLFYDINYDEDIEKKWENLYVAEYPEEFTTGHLISIVHPFLGELFLKNGNKIKTGDPILEIHWPEDEQSWPKGVKDVLKSFYAMAELLEQRPEIKAVIGRSWLMSRKISDDFGFEKFPDIPVDKDIKIESALEGNYARKDKPFPSFVDPESVILGAITRDDFLARYSQNKKEKIET